MKRSTPLEQLAASKVIAILRSSSQQYLVPSVHALVGAGMTCVEITFNTPGSLSAMIELSKELDSSKVLLGAGTILSVEDAQQAITAGAAFVVTPTLNTAVIGYCKREGVMVIPGAFTQTEIQEAWQLGADMVKVFPAGTVGPGYIKALLAPLPHLRLVPTGGVTPKNAVDYLHAGATAVGIGSALTGTLEHFDEALLRQRTQALFAAIN